MVLGFLLLVLPLLVLFFALDRVYSVSMLCFPADLSGFDVFNANI